MFLPNTTDKIEVVLSTAFAVDVFTDWVDAANSAGMAPQGAGSTRAAITTTAATDISGSPASGNVRTIKRSTIRNKDASITGDATVRLNANGTIYEIHKQTLAPGETLQYENSLGWFELNNVSINRMLSSIESSDAQRVLVPSAQGIHGNLHTFVCISGTAYYVYIGRTVQDITVKFLEFQITGAGAGTDTKEVGLFSTPAPPNKGGQTLTKIVATGTVDSGTTTGYKRNTSSFAQLVPAGTHLWAALRTALATTQPTVGGLGGDMGAGSILTTTGGGALTGLSTAAGSIIAAGTATVAPFMQLTLD